MLLTYACFTNFKLFQIDVKSTFLNGYTAEKIYVKQPPSFENHEYPDHVFKLNKVLYDLKQTLRTWYERLSKFLLENNFSRRKVDIIFFYKKKDKEILVI